LWHVLIHCQKSSLTTIIVSFLNDL
jgi:hypothetical protein